MRDTVGDTFAGAGEESPCQVHSRGVDQKPTTRLTLAVRGGDGCV